MSGDGERPPDARLIGGRYRLTGRLGSGPTGTVWRARDEQGRGHVAVKEPLLPGDPADDEESRRSAHRLYREARAAARVRHPSAVTVYDVVTEAGVPWIVMELVAGESLEEALRRGPLPPAEAARIGLAVLGALSAAHGVGIVHRDVKPANVLIESGTGRVVVTDFAIGDGHTEESPAGFVAPERAAGPGAGPASDLWSLGALLRSAVGNADPGELGSLGPLLDRLHADSPEARPGAQEVAAELRAYLGLPPAPEPRTPAPASGPQSGAPAAASGPQSGASAAAPAPHSGTPAPAPSPEARTRVSAAEPVTAAEPVPAPGSMPAPGSAPAPESVPEPVPDASGRGRGQERDPRRRTPLAALGLLLAKKPGTD
ncbi:protein kinase [Streptomyces sp. NPDC051133]|uniref:serine/threonine-protein kinase n=1 Tax=Streptomyces sp. NPDC051133 TaxID=3155521 RepID=UPI00343349B2